jgi:hypothetical protein
MLLVYAIVAITILNIYEVSMESVKNTVCSFGNLYKAMYKCKRGVSWKDSVSRYVNNGLSSITKLQHCLESNTYRIDKYYEFVIHEPKTRNIISTKFKDRVFQRSLCDNYLYHEITKSFIYDNGACQINKGTDFTRNRLKTHLHRYYRKHGAEGYVLKCDFKNYFGSTRHNIAKQALAKVVKDTWALDCCYDIIDTYNTGDATGLGLGSQITQLVELLVLNDLDHYIKEKLKIKCYVRYMDDLVLIHKDKRYLKECLTRIDRIADGLELSLNTSKTGIFKLSQGINFLGFKYSISGTGRVYSTVLKDNIKKRKRKLRKYSKTYAKGNMTLKQINDGYESWKNHVNKGNSYNTVRRMDVYYNQLYGRRKRCLEN